MTIKELLKYVGDTNSSDLHLLANTLPVVRTFGVLLPVKNSKVLTDESIRSMIFELIDAKQKETLLQEKELDFSVGVPGMARFRVNAYLQQNTMAGAFRLIPEKIPSIDDLRLPKIVHSLATPKQGFVLVVGPTGHGKTSTLAAIVNEINLTRTENIIIIEDPVEFVHQNKKSIISHRELGPDTETWARALKSVLRQDPNVVLVGEMRDPETMSAALTIAETGHLVFATLHTNSASQTIDRIIDSFPEGQQSQVRVQLAATLGAVLSQRLVPSLDGKRVVATELLIATPAVRNTIREAKTHQIDNIIQTGLEQGMFLFEMSLSELVSQKLIDEQIARRYALRPAVLDRLLE